MGCVSVFGLMLCDCCLLVCVIVVFCVMCSVCFVCGFFANYCVVLYSLDACVVLCVCVRVLCSIVCFA